MERIQFITSLLTFYMKGEIVCEQNFINYKAPNSLLGIIPLGVEQEMIPINQISSTQSHFRIKLLRLIFGLLCAVEAIGGLCLGEAQGEFFIFFVIYVVLGILLLLGAFDVKLQIHMTSGQTRLIRFFIFDKSKAERAEQAINALISDRLNDTNTRQQTDRIVEAINNK